jgi:hypothetical protein
VVSNTAALSPISSHHMLIADFFCMDGLTVQPP